MPEPRDYAADPSCSSRCLYLPCYLSITSTPSDWRKSTRLSPSFRLGRAFSTWERGPASRPWNSSAEVSTLPRLRSPNSNYATQRVFPITDYDGWTIPLADASIDVVFSSNVLEHVADLARMHAEIRRVLAPGGTCLHVLPTHTWRLWSTLASYLEAISFSTSSLPRLFPQATPRAAELQRLREAWYRTARHTVGLCLPRRHGERGNVISELWLFHPRWWRRNFRDNGFAVVGDEPMGLFYTGEVLFGLRLGLAKRERLARVLGSSCHLFRLVPVPRR